MHRQGVEEKIRAKREEVANAATELATATKEAKASGADPSADMRVQRQIRRLQVHHAKLMDEESALCKELAALEVCIIPPLLTRSHDLSL